MTPRQRVQLQREPPGIRLAREELLEKERVRAEFHRFVAREHRAELVAQRQQARGFEPDDRYAARGVRRQRIEQPARLVARLVHHTDRKEGAAAAERPARVRRTRDVNAITRGLEHAQRGDRVLRLEVVVERVGEQDDVAVLRRTYLIASGGRLQERAGLPLRQAALRREADQLLAERREDRYAVAQVDERRQTRGDRRIAREEGDEPVLQSPAVAAVVVMEKLDLHPRHVDAGRAFALAALAADAEIERLVERVGGESIRSKLPGDREPQRIRAAAGEMLLVAGRTERRDTSSRRRTCGSGRCCCTSRPPPRTPGSPRRGRSTRTSRARCPGATSRTPA